MNRRAGLTLVVLALAASPFAAQPSSPPKILYQTSPKAIEYQLSRLTNAELALVERSATDPKYRPVYIALLTRKGMGREYFDEALAALTRIDHATPTQVLLDALPKVKTDDDEAAARLIRVLLAQPAGALKKERSVLVNAVEAAASPLVLRAAYGGLMVVDGHPEPAWQIAAKRDGHLLELLQSIPHLPPAANELRSQLFAPVAALLKGTPDTAMRVAAISALGATRQDAATFRLLAHEVLQATDPELRAAAIRSLQRLPSDAWPQAEIEPLARAIIATAQKTGADRRTDPVLIEALQLGEKLANGLPNGSRAAVRRDLRALGVQVVRVETIPEQMMFDLKWFAVEAGKRVQIIFYNPDAMPHNLLLVKPGALKEIGMAASTMTPSQDPKAKPYVPDTPLVLQATRLLNWAETDRLAFVAPREPGEYPFVCTFPGHWVRMYGVMLVVENLEAWEASPVVPRDPMTNQPYPAQR